MYHLMKMKRKKTFFFFCPNTHLNKSGEYRIKCASLWLYMAARWISRSSSPSSLSWWCVWEQSVLYYLLYNCIPRDSYWFFFLPLLRLLKRRRSLLTHTHSQNTIRLVIKSQRRARQTCVCHTHTITESNIKIHWKKCTQTWTDAKCGPILAHTNAIFSICRLYRAHTPLSLTHVFYLIVSTFGVLQGTYTKYAYQSSFSRARTYTSNMHGSEWAGMRCSRKMERQREREKSRRWWWESDR